MASQAYSQFHSVHKVKYSRLIVAYANKEELKKSQVIAEAVKLYFDTMSPEKLKIYENHFQFMRENGLLTKHEREAQTPPRPIAYNIMQTKIKDHQNGLINRRNRKKTSA